MGKQKTNYPKETAGFLMQAEVPAVHANGSIGTVRKYLRTNAASFDSFNYVYLVSDTGQLAGVISMKQVLSGSAKRPVRELMQTDMVTARPHTDQEHIARLALQHQLKAIPIVDSKQHLLGVVPPHTILQILHDEHVEDLLKQAGVLHQGFARKPHAIGTQVRHRLPWLLIGMLGGLLAAGIVQQFETALEQQLLLAAFIPTIVYLADAVGTQVQTIYIRAYAFGISQDLRSHIFREALVAGLLALFISAMITLLVLLWFGAILLALIVGSAVFFSMLFASLIAVILPWLFQKRGFDPAVASGPLGTILRDLTSIAVYFWIAQYLLNLPH